MRLHGLRSHHPRRQLSHRCARRGTKWCRRVRSLTERKEGEREKLHILSSFKNFRLSTANCLYSQCVTSCFLAVFLLKQKLDIVKVFNWPSSLPLVPSSFLLPPVVRPAEVLGIPLLITCQIRRQIGLEHYSKRWRCLCSACVAGCNDQPVSAGQGIRRVPAEYTVLLFSGPHLTREHPCCFCTRTMSTDVGWAMFPSCNIKQKWASFL